MEIDLAAKDPGYTPYLIDYAESLGYARNGAGKALPNGFDKLDVKAARKLYNSFHAATCKATPKVTPESVARAAAILERYLTRHPQSAEIEGLSNETADFLILNLCRMMVNGRGMFYVKEREDAWHLEKRVKCKATPRCFESKTRRPVSTTPLIGAGIC